MRVALSHAEPAQIKSHFLNFYPDAEPALADEFAALVADTKISMAHIQGHFLMNKNNPKAAVSGAKLLREQASASPL